MSTSGQSVCNSGDMAGLQSIHGACQALYPDQPNPLQVTARLKYWLGGPDPLDYISMYWNPGKPDLCIPPHWHYVSFGLSDLHGDGRVHPLPPSGKLSQDNSSGFGIELTIRVLGEAGTPPTWPAALLQRLATYIFTTGNCLFVGDHVSWHAPLDGGIIVPPSTVCHMIIAQDPQLTPLHTSLGKVQFVQVVGVTKEELRAAQRYGGSPLLSSLAENSRCGGPWLITDINRRSWVEVVGPSGPSDLSGVAAHCQWEPLPLLSPKQFVKGAAKLAETVKDEIKCILQKGLSEINPEQSSDKENELTENDTVNKDDCKMSTDSVKFIHTKATTRMECKLEMPSVKALFSSSHRTPNMSTDSFNMTQMQSALLNTNTNVQEQRQIRNDEASDKTDIKTHQPNDGQEAGSSLCSCPTNENDNKTKDANIFPQCEVCGRETPYSLLGAHLIFDREAAALLPLALRGRVLHKSHFTWSSTATGGGQAITLLGNGVTGALVVPYAPIAVVQGWLQVLIPEDMALDMCEQLAELENESEVHRNIRDNGKLYSFRWDNWSLNISVLPS